MWNSTLGKSSEEAEELTLCCPEQAEKHYVAEAAP